MRPRAEENFELRNAAPRAELVHEKRAPADSIESSARSAELFFVRRRPCNRSRVSPVHRSERALQVGCVLEAREVRRAARVDHERGESMLGRELFELSKRESRFSRLGRAHVPEEPERATHVVAELGGGGSSGFRTENSGRRASCARFASRCSFASAETASSRDFHASASTAANAIPPKRSRSPKNLSRCRRAYGPRSESTARSPAVKVESRSTVRGSSSTPCAWIAIPTATPVKPSRSARSSSTVEIEGRVGSSAGGGDPPAEVSELPGGGAPGAPSSARASIPAAARASRISSAREPPGASGGSIVRGGESEGELAGEPAAPAEFELAAALPFCPEPADFELFGELSIGEAAGIPRPFRCVVRFDSRRQSRTVVT